MPLYTNLSFRTSISKQIPWNHPSQNIDPLFSLLPLLCQDDLARLCILSPCLLSSASQFFDNEPSRHQGAHRQSQ